MDPVAAGMAEAASRFLSALGDEQRARVTFPFEGDERLTWYYWPAERGGLALAGMDEPQRALAGALLASGLSAAAHETARRIVGLERVLQVLEAETGAAFFPRDPDLYSFSVFGEPGGAGPWGWRAEGHHLSVHFAVVGGRVVAHTPSFFGANPAEVPSGPEKGLRVLAPLEDRARDLVSTLDAKQMARALLDGEAPPDILTRNAPRAEIGAPEGLPASEMTGAQREALVALVREYTGRVPAPLAEPAVAGLRLDGINAVRFAWAGGARRGAPHYYRIHGGSFLVEYDNVQNEANHIHAVWRDVRNDFGEDALRAHRREAH